MNEEPVGLLMRQAAWELGSFSTSTELREAHQVFEDPAFCIRLVEVLEQRLRDIQSNWNEHRTLHSLVALSLRLLSLSVEPAIAEHTVSFLRASRRASVGWCQTLLESLDSLTGDDSDALEMLIIKVGGVCQLTYAVELQHLPMVFANDEDLKAFIWSAIIMYDNTPKSSCQLPAETKAILLRTKRILHHVEDRARQQIQLNASGLNEALEMIAPNVQVCAPWRFGTENISRWATNKTRATSHRHQQEIHYNLLSGEHLVDNSPPGRLPVNYTRHPLFERIFGLVSLDILLNDGLRQC